MPSIRHTCIVCGRKKVERKMVKVRSHWHCDNCLVPTDQREITPLSCAYPIRRRMTILNLFCGIGGNRKLWPDTVQITGVENNPKIAAIYKNLYPNDTVIITDAYNYLLKNYHQFDFIWLSPPCQSHTRLNYTLAIDNKRYPDLKLYEVIIFLRSFRKKPFVIENVIPYYKPLIEPDYKIDRHLFWCNFELSIITVPKLTNFFKMNDKKHLQPLMDYFDIQITERAYSTSKKVTQIFKNCLHPKIGLSIFNDMINHLKNEKTTLAKAQIEKNNQRRV